MADADEENQQFEQVLNRLDALMKRSHSGPPPSIEPANSQMLEITLPPLESAGADFPPLPSAEPEVNDSHFFVLEEKENAEIPVLTEIYDGTPSSSLPNPDPSEETIDTIVDALIPLMLDNLDMIVAEEAAKMQLAIVDRLRLEIGETLRQRLLGRD